MRVSSQNGDNSLQIVSLVGLVAYAKSKGCWWINLDQDEDIESDIPTFDW